MQPITVARWAVVFAVGHVVAAMAQQPPPPLGNPPVPAANPLTTAKINLGQALFWEEQLSVTGTVACGSCHRGFSGGSDPRTAPAAPANTHPGPDGVFGGADDVQGSPGVPAHAANGLYTVNPLFGMAAQISSRKSQSAVNAAFSNLLFWDGRAGPSFSDPQTGQLLIAQGGALENQALQPLLNMAEMAPSAAQAADLGARLVDAQPLALATALPESLGTWIAGRRYSALFAEAFGNSDISAARIVMAIASYERTLVANQAPIDAEFGGTPTLTALERQGQQVFTANDCAACHAGSLFSDNQFRYIGVRPVTDDLGRFAITGNNADRGAFRTPSLRNVALRAPYMHTGRLATLEDVVEFYNRGGDFTAPNKDPRIRPRNLSQQQKTALLAFLRRPLTDLRAQAETGPFARPALYTESDRQPQIVGVGTPGSGGTQPLIGAIEPPLLGNRNFTVALSHALGGAVATLVVSRSDPGVQADIPTGDFANLVVTVAGTGAGLGTASVNVDLGTDPALIGQTLYGRYYLVDPAAADGLAVTPAFRIVVFGDGDRVFANGYD